MIIPSLRGIFLATLLLSGIVGILIGGALIGDLLGSRADGILVGYCLLVIVGLAYLIDGVK